MLTLFAGELIAAIWRWWISAFICKAYRW